MAGSRVFAVPTRWETRIIRSGQENDVARRGRDRGYGGRAWGPGQGCGPLDRGGSRIGLGGPCRRGRAEWGRAWGGAREAAGVSSAYMVKDDPGVTTARVVPGSCGSRGEVGGRAYAGGRGWKPDRAGQAGDWCEQAGRRRPRARLGP